MRHAAKPITAVTVASWLVVTALGLSMGALGAGGVVDLLTGDHSVDLPASSKVLDLPSVESAVDPPASSGKTLSGSTVVKPQQVPDGAALPGRAPAARGAGTDYASFRPTTLRLPSGNQAPIQRAGVHTDGALNIPTDPGRVGWWTGGALAGEPFGSMVLAGHVDSRTYGIGVMAEMLRMKPGQVVTVSAGTKTEKYTVVSVQKIPKAALAEGTDLFDQDVAHRLVMITCGGPFDVRTHRYRDNVVVIAEPVT